MKLPCLNIIVIVDRDAPRHILASRENRVTTVIFGSRLKSNEERILDRFRRNEDTAYFISNVNNPFAVREKSVGSLRCWPGEPGPHAPSSHRLAAVRSGEPLKNVLKTRELVGGPRRTAFSLAGANSFRTLRWLVELAFQEVSVRRQILATTAFTELRM